MSRTLTALFDSRREAEAAKERLQAARIDVSRIDRRIDRSPIAADHAGGRVAGRAEHAAVARGADRDHRPAVVRRPGRAGHRWRSQPRAPPAAGLTVGAGGPDSDPATAGGTVVDPRRSPP